jgi:hypothetical protein
MGKRSSISSGNDTQRKKTKGSSGGPKKRKLPTSFLDCQSLSLVVNNPHHDDQASKEEQQQFCITPVVSESTKEIFLDRFIKEIVKQYQPIKKKKKHSTNNKNDSTTTTTTTTATAMVLMNGKLVQKSINITAKSNNNSTIEQQQQQEQQQEEEDENSKRILWKERMIIGTNQCSRRLEELLAVSATPPPPRRRPRRQPSLIVMAHDVHPATMLVHVPPIANTLRIPLMLLPGRSSIELGNALNVKRTSIVMFVPSSSSSENDNDTKRSDDNVDGHVGDDDEDPIDSFVEFVTTQLLITADERNSS